MNYFKICQAAWLTSGLIRQTAWLGAARSPHVKKNKKNSPIFFELLRLVNANIIPFVELNL